MKKQLTYLIICAISFSFLTCKKTKLDGDYSRLVGTWQWYGGWSDNGTTALKLDLKERGKYKLYKGNKKIEHGRLLKKGEFLEFKSDNVIDNLVNKYLFLNGREIIFITDSTIGIGCGDCRDAPSSAFKKK